MSFCARCGKEMAEGALFCMNCGCRADGAPASAGMPAGAPTAAPAAAPAPAPGNAAPGYAAPTYAPPGYGAPVGKMKTNRGLLKFILLSMITLGIYGLVVMSVLSSNINTIASRYDGKKTMHYCLVYFIFSWLTLGIVPLIWFHRVSARIGNELARRGLAYNFGAGTYWGWGILGSLIVVGPFIYYHKLFRAMNLVCGHYNMYG